MAVRRPSSWEPAWLRCARSARCVVAGAPALSSCWVRNPGRPTIASTLTYRGDIVETHASYLGSIFRPYKVLNHTISIMMRAFEQGLREAIPLNERENTIFLAPRLEYSGGRVGTFDFGLARDTPRS